MENIIISKPNAKGQVVIPKYIRDVLNINPSVYLQITLFGSGIHIYPITETKTAEINERKKLTLSQVLEITKGAWVDDKDDRAYLKKRRAIELAAAKKRREATW